MAYESILRVLFQSTCIFIINSYHQLFHSRIGPSAPSREGPMDLTLINILATHGAILSIISFQNISLGAPISFIFIHFSFDISFTLGPSFTKV